MADRCYGGFERCEPPPVPPSNSYPTRSFPQLALVLRLSGSSARTVAFSSSFFPSQSSFGRIGGHWHVQSHLDT